MSTFKHHTSCPNCGSRDNLGIYTDHEWCFGCGYYKSYGLNLEDFVWKYKQKQQKEIATEVSLPFDISTAIRPDAKLWLNKYLTEEEIKNNRCLWSETDERLYFPFFDNVGSIIAFQGRYFGNQSKPKWWGKGIKDLVQIYSTGNYSKIVLVEDILSAIVVARNWPHIAASPLFGSHISNDMLLRYKRYTNTLDIWLDPDKRKEAVNYTMKATILGFTAKVIFSNKDPKEHNKFELELCLLN